MNRTTGVPVRQPIPEIPEHVLPIGPTGRERSHESDSLVLYLAPLWQQRRLLARTSLYGLLASTLLAFLIPVRFESTARLMPPDSGPSTGLAMAAAALSANAGGFAGLASSMLGLKSTSDIFAGVLSSRTVQDRLIEQFDLKRLYGDSKMEDARKHLAEHTTVSIDLKSQIITISVIDHDPRRAAAMGQAYVEQLNRLVADLSTSSARRERIFLEERLQGVTKDLESAEKDFSQFASKNTAIDIKEQGKAMVEAAATLQGELIAAQSELEGLRQIYSDNNVRIRSVRARITELEHNLEKIGGKDEDTEGSGAQQAEQLYPSIRKLPLLGVTYSDLYRRTRVQEAVFETLTKEYELAKVQEAKEIPNVKVLDAPNIPDKKSFPPRLAIMVLGTAFAFALGAAWSLGRASWEETDPNDPRKAFATEVFATVKASVASMSRKRTGPNARGHFWVQQREKTLQDEHDRRNGNVGGNGDGNV